MKETFRLKGVPTIIPAVVESVKNAGGQIGVRLEYWSETDNPGTTMQVRVVGTSPRIKDRGLCLFIDNNDNSFQNGYWIGTITNRFINKDDRPTTSEQFENKLPEGTRGMIDDSGNNQIIATGAGILIKSKLNELKLSQDNFSISNGTSTFTFNNDGISINAIKNNEVTARLNINNKLTDVYSTGGVLLRSNGDINIKSNGNVYFGANTTENKSLSLFHVKASKVVLESGSGPMTIQGSQFNVKVGSSAANSLGTTAASIEVLQGNIDFSAGVGNITLRALSPAHKVKITNGYTISGIQSYFEASVASAKMGAELVPGTGASIECTRIGDINTSAIKNITIKSTLATKLSALTTMELNALVSMKLETLKAEIIATSMLKIESAMMDLKKAKMIDFGPKTATPGKGPLCSLPVCPITGCMHTGSVCIG